VCHHGLVLGGRSIQLARVFGIRIGADTSWFIFLFLIIWLQSNQYKDQFPGDDTKAFSLAVATAFLFVLSILLHELGHAWVAIRNGIGIVGIDLWMFGGVAKMQKDAESPGVDFRIAAAGPVVTLLIAALCFGIGAATIGAHEFWRVITFDRAAGAGTTLVADICFINGLLLVFNLLPGLPLDGGRLLRAAAAGLGARPATATRVAGWAGRVLAVGVALAGLLANRSSGAVAANVFTFALAGYLWLAASQSLRYAMVLDRLPRVSVPELLRPGVFIPDDVSVGEALDRAWQVEARGLVLLDAASHPSAIVDEALIGAVPPEQRAGTPVTTVARPLEPGLMIPEDVDAAGLLRLMQTTPSHEYLVVRPDGSAAGIIAARDFADRLATGASR
jgi:Zn-dependent protease